MSAWKYAYQMPLGEFLVGVGRAGWQVSQSGQIYLVSNVPRDGGRHLVVRHLVGLYDGIFHIFRTNLKPQDPLDPRLIHPEWPMKA